MVLKFYSQRGLRRYVKSGEDDTLPEFQIWLAQSNWSSDQLQGLQRTPQDEVSVQGNRIRNETANYHKNCLENHQTEMIQNNLVMFN